jgi:hypothetical protein
METTPAVKGFVRSYTALAAYAATAERDEGSGRGNTTAWIVVANGAPTDYGVVYLNSTGVSAAETDRFESSLRLEYVAPVVSVVAPASQFAVGAHAAGETTT